MKTNCYNILLEVKCVPGDNHEAIVTELADVLIDLDMLPYDYELKLQKVGEYI